MERLTFALVTPLGSAACTLDDAGRLRELKLTSDTGQLPPAPEHPLAAQVQRQLTEYLAKARREFTVPLSPQGTPFQLVVWDELTRIPYGSTITYGELAQRVDARLGATAAQQHALDAPAEASGGRALPPGGSLRIRAVGRANGQNPIWIIIPCHRVIGADGSLTGYAGGIDVKRALLELEGAQRPGGGLFD